MKSVDASRSRQALSNEYLIALIGIGTAENGPSRVGVSLQEWEKSSENIIFGFVAS